MVTSCNALKTAVVSTNDYITEFHLDLNMFATLFFGMLDPNTGSLFYINGGHCPPYLLNKDGEIKERLEPTTTSFPRQRSSWIMPLPNGLAPCGCQTGNTGAGIK